MQYRQLGRTDLTVSTVCLGCWALVGDGTWGEQDRDASRAAIHAALSFARRLIGLLAGRARKLNQLLGHVVGN